MASSFPDGTIFSIGTVLGTAKTISAISNANPGVASATTHGFTDGDIVMLSSGWTALDGQVIRVDGSTTDAFNVEGIDTSDTGQYPAGSGGGSAREVTTWVAMSQVTDVAPSGGEQQFYQWRYMEERTQRQRPTLKTARSMAITLDYDPNLAWHAALLAADRSGSPVPFKATLPSGAEIYWSMYVAFDGEPSFAISENQQVIANFSFNNPRSIRYEPAA